MVGDHKSIAIKHISVALLLTMVLILCAGQPVYAAKKKPAKKAYVMDEMTRLTLITEAFAATNAQRQAIGLPPLAWDQDLFNTAEIRSNEIVILFEHVRPDGTPCGTAAPGMLYGENILKGNASSIKSGTGAVGAWMTSPGHKANILKPEYTKGAVSLRYVNGSYYWIQAFAY